MPQPKSPSSRKPSTGPAASPSRAQAAKTKKPASPQPGAPPRAATRKAKGASRAATATAASGAKRPAGATRSHPQKAADDTLSAAVGAIRSSLARGLVLTGERLQETIDDAAKRGHLTPRDGEDLAQRLISVGRKQADELLRDLEQIVERGGDELIRASRELRKKLR
jgi:polyhydroxyalkanoate synthesis regulator phasin